MAAESEIIIQLTARTDDATADIKRLETQLVKTKDAAKKVSEDGIERIVKNGGAIGLLNDLTGGLAMQFKDAYESIQLTNTGLKGMKAALLATGIGAAVVAIGALVANWEKVVSLLKASTVEIDKQIAHTKLLIVESNHQLAVFNAMEASLRAQGSTDADILKGRKEILQTTIAETKTLILQTEEKLKQLKISQQESTIWAAVAKLVVGGPLGGTAESAVKSVMGSEEEIAQAKADLQALELQMANLKSGVVAVNNAQNTAAKAAAEQAAKTRKYLEEQAEDEDPSVDIPADVKLRMDAHKTELEQKKKDEEEYDEWYNNLMAEQFAEDERRRQERKQAEKDEAEYKRNLQTSGFQLAGALNDLLFAKQGQQSREGFRVAKALAISEAAVSTYQAAISAYSTASKSPYAILNPAYPAIQAGIAVAFGLAQVAKIGSQQFNSGVSGGSGGGVPSFGGGQAPTPTNPQPALDFSFLNQNQPVQTYVIADDVKNANEANQKLKDQSTL